MPTAKAGAGQGEQPAHADQHEHSPEIIAPRTSGDRPLRSVPATRRCESCGQMVIDPPTGLIERWHWDEAAADVVAVARSRGDSIALIMIDLDRFKEVNDSYGHLAGDAVLRSVADVIRDKTREGDLACRYGGSAGDEFLVLLPSTELDDALAVAERIRAGITSMSVTAKVTRELSATIEGQTASIGVATYILGDLVELDLEDLMLDADVSLRAAKRHGRDRICVANMDVTGNRASSSQAGRRLTTWSRFRRLRSV
ncbi:GGDEF domain-containing protein [Actinophytocola sp.]|uniref:GGDEF domain-containing protein n=1 Tax=Actinophytocola sp. TaxID=1872138 RepID=UPI002D6B05A0|nr:GGDEF domain-containing protein [Actinophytocola sp.]HYQ62094.1 GGDEF domain-containing protein [Actinophytocola sp.]